ncbi:hypothetical protein HD806DRAFT_529721 [Xylariaceae sp. AK1471]|nr:hypothetical protein HD806DRAFT_529721 [Xylariaceae sp. AK1471]
MSYSMISTVSTSGTSFEIVDIYTVDSDGRAELISQEWWKDGYTPPPSPPPGTVVPHMSSSTISTATNSLTSYQVIYLYTIDSNGETSFLTYEWWSFSSDRDSSPATPTMSESTTSSSPISPTTSPTTSPTRFTNVTPETTRAISPGPSAGSDSDTARRRGNPETIAVIAIGAIIGIAILAGIGWLVHYCRRRARRAKTKSPGEEGNNNSLIGHSGERYEKPELEANTCPVVKAGDHANVSLGMGMDTERPQLPPVELEAPLPSTFSQKESQGEGQQKAGDKEMVVLGGKEHAEKSRVDP